MRVFDADRRPKVQDCITEILVDEFPLTVNELRLRIREKHSLSVSYQAVHKEVNRLHALGVLQNEGDGYLLSMGWVLQNIDFFRKAEANVQNRSTIRYISFDMNDTLTPGKFDAMVWDEAIPRLYAKEHRIDLRAAKREVYAQYYRALYVEKAAGWMELEYWFTRLKIDGWKPLIEDVSHRIELYDDVEETLEKLSRRYKLVVFARGDTKFMELKLEAAGIRKYFTHIISPTILKMSGKDKEAFEALLVKLKIKPKNIIHVGNDLAMDYTAPTSAGIKALLLDRSGSAEAEHVIKSLKDLQHMF